MDAGERDPHCLHFFNLPAQRHMRKNPISAASYGRRRKSPRTATQTRMVICASRSRWCRAFVRNWTLTPSMAASLPSFLSSLRCIFGSTAPPRNPVPMWRSLRTHECTCVTGMKTPIMRWNSNERSSSVKLLPRCRYSTATNRLELEEFNRRLLDQSDAALVCWANVDELRVRSQMMQWRDTRKVRALVAGPPDRNPKKVLVASPPKNDVDVVLDLRNSAKVTPDALDPLIKKTRTPHNASATKP